MTRVQISRTFVKKKKSMQGCMSVIIPVLWRMETGGFGELLTSYSSQLVSSEFRERLCLKDWSRKWPRKAPSFNFPVHAHKWVCLLLTSPTKRNAQLDGVGSKMEVVQRRLAWPSMMMVCTFVRCSIFLKTLNKCKNLYVINDFPEYKSILSDILYT